MSDGDLDRILSHEDPFGPWRDSWLAREFAAAEREYAALPPEARPVVVREPGPVLPHELLLDEDPDAALAVILGKRKGDKAYAAICLAQAIKHGDYPAGVAATEETIVSGNEPQIRTHDFIIGPDDGVRYRGRPGILLLEINRVKPGGGEATSTIVGLRMADLLALRETIDRYLDTETPCGGCSGGFTYRYGGDPPEARRWIPHGDECVFWLADDERTDQERERDQ